MDGGSLIHYSPYFNDLEFLGILIFFADFFDIRENCGYN